jgi:pimeloyl-ACP methyl ester carboxylesterase
LTERLVTRDGLTLSYRLLGDGPLLVCQPGGPGRRASYLQDLGGLARTRTLVLLDPRGTGDSERPDDVARLAAPYLADDLEALREHLGLTTVDLLGHSAGAMVAELYAAAHPAALRRLVLVTPSTRLHHATPPDLSAVVEGRRGEPHLAEVLAAYDRGAGGAATRPLWYGVWNDATAAHAAGTDAEMDRLAERSFSDAALDADAVVAALAEVTARVLVLVGDKDALTGGAEVVRPLVEAFADARLAVLAGCGHYPWVERPAAFAEAVEDFLGG